MKTATLTKEGAERIGYPELAGKTVEYDKISELGACVKNVFFGGKRICSTLDFTGKTRGLILTD